LGAALAALACAALVAACGSGDDTSPPQPPPTRFEVEGKAPADGESVAEARRRISRVLATERCKRINGLNPLSRPQLDAAARCESLRRIADLAPVAAEHFGSGGAVIDYVRGARTVSVLLVRDSDDRLHVAFIDPFLGEPSVGSAMPDAFDRAARDAVASLRAGGCEEFLALAYRRLGPGAGSRGEVCSRLDAYGPAKLLRDAPEAKPRRYGGNGSYALYRVAAGDADLTFVLARQEDAEGLPGEVAELPGEAARYAFVDAYRVDEAAGEPGK